ncbi:MAG: c-type cytochrome biogenesis protein CcmI [Agarilytica sp.]
MEFWQFFLLVNILAAIFVVWPTVFLAKKYRQQLRSNARTDSNEDVYQDHVLELEQTLVRGEIDADELAGLKRDLEKTMVEENHMDGDMSDRPIISSFKSRIPVLTLVFLLPIFSMFLYSILGAKKDWDIYQLATTRVHAPAEDVVELTDELMEALQSRVKDKPDNAQNWYLLASTAIEQGSFEEAVRAYRQVLEIEPNAPTIKAELAQALFLRAGNTITPEVRKHANEVLAVAPNMPTALGLAGIDAYRSGEYQTAIEHWKKALVQLDPDSDAAQALTGGIARSTIALSKSGEQPTADEEKGLSVTVKVSLAKKAAGVNKTDTVFVYARAFQGPPMPLAIQKVTVAELPITLTLDNSMSMMQGMDLAAFPQIEVIARVSSSGSATPQPGDWQAKQGPIIVSSQKAPIKLKISEQIPSK